MDEENKTISSRKKPSKRHSYAGRHGVGHTKFYSDIIRKKDQPKMPKGKLKVSFSQKLKNIFTCSKVNSQVVFVEEKKSSTKDSVQENSTACANELLNEKSSVILSILVQENSSTMVSDVDQSSIDALK